MGATACIALPEFADAFPEPGGWTRLAWWIHDHLPYSSLYFFPKSWAVNVQWYEKPERRIDRLAGWHSADGWKKQGTLTKRGMPSHDVPHNSGWQTMRGRFELPTNA